MLQEPGGGRRADVALCSDVCVCVKKRKQSEKIFAQTGFSAGQVKLDL